jgi:hypothetical protein
MLLHDLHFVQLSKVQTENGYPHQTSEALYWSLLVETIHLIIRQLEAEIAGQSEKNTGIRFQRGQETGRRPVSHELRDARQHFSIRRLVATTMGGAQENYPLRGILD